MSCASASTTQPSARRNTLRSELYEKTKQKWCLRILVWLMALMVFLGVADSCRVQEDHHRTLVQGSLQELNDSWTLETDQQAVYDIPESMGESLMLSIRSTKQKFSLGLRAADGQETVFYTYDPDSGPAEMRLFAALPEGAAGKTLVLRCAEPSALSVMLSSESVLATQTKLSSYYFRRSLYALVFFLLCVLCAVELGVLMVTMRSIFTPEVCHQTRVMIGLMLDVGIWALTDSELLALVTDRANLVVFVSLVTFSLTAPFVLEFIRCTVKNDGWLIRLPQMAALVLLAAFHTLMVSYKKNHSGEVRNILLAFGALAAGTLLALATFYSGYRDRTYAVCYCAGLLGFLVMLGRIVLHRIRQASDEQAQLENYKNLAYVDSLTGLFNYTAFKYMKSRWPERTDWTYIVMDINWLKQTNDQYGHRAGDELLCCAARCIREAFYRAEDCFRIGGDEFAVIAAATDEDAVKAAVETLRRLCAEWDAKEEYPVSIAVGYAMQAGRIMTADELFMEADAAMYRNKAEIKKAVGGISR